MSAHPLRAFRDRQTPKLSQKGLAELLGVARETVSRWESGIRNVDDDCLPKVVEKTGIPATELRPDLVRLLAPAADEQTDSNSPPSAPAPEPTKHAVNS